MVLSRTLAVGCGSRLYSVDMTRTVIGVKCGKSQVASHPSLKKLLKLGPTDINQAARVSNAGERLLRRAHFDIYHKPSDGRNTPGNIFIMSETMFAKALMSGLEKRPSRLSSDHVSDPRKYPAQAPVCIHRHDPLTEHTLISPT